MGNTDHLNKTPLMILITSKTDCRVLNFCFWPTVLYYDITDQNNSNSNRLEV